MTNRQETPQEAIKKIKAWKLPKEIQVRELEKSMEAHKLYMKLLNEDLKSGFFIKQAKRDIETAETISAKKLKELDLEMLEKELEFDLLRKRAIIVGEDIQSKLDIEKKTVEVLDKQIKLAGRNHKVKITPDSEIKKEDAKELTDKVLEESK